MSDVHLHLLLNHVPILGTLFAFLLGLYGALRRQPAVVRAALLALVVTGIASVAALRTGEGAEDAVERLPGVSESILHDHEEAAESANVAAILLAIASLGILFWRRKAPDLGTPATVVVLAGALVVFGLMARTGNLGGQIRHTEIRDGTAPEASGATARPGDEHESHDDD
jgi:uncharacterized membrane protein